MLKMCLGASNLQKLHCGKEVRLEFLAKLDIIRKKGAVFLLFEPGNAIINMAQYFRISVVSSGNRK